MSLHEPLQPSPSSVEQPTGDTHVVRQSPYLDVRGAADYLHYTVGSFYKAFKRLGSPHYRRDRKLLFLPAELDAWLVSHSRRRHGAPTLHQGGRRA